MLVIKLQLSEDSKVNCEIILTIIIITFITGGLLSYFKGLFGNREMRILILGLDGAGKTTILYR